MREPDTSARDDLASGRGERHDSTGGAPTSSRDRDGDGAPAGANDDPGSGEVGDGGEVEDAAGRFAAWSARADRVRTTATDRLETVEDRWPPIRVGRAFITRYLQVNGVVLSGHLAFRSFSFLLPLGLVVIAIAGLATYFGYDPGEATTNNLKLGQALGNAMRSAGQETARTPYHVAVVALIGLLLGAMGMLSGLNYVYAQAWRVGRQKVVGKLNKLWRLVLAVIVLVLALGAGSALRESGFIIGLAGTTGVAVVFFFAFLGLGLIMPRRCKEWIWLLPGAAVGGIGLLGLQIFANVYLPSHLSSLSETYGAFALTAVLLSYLFLVGQIIVASAIASAVWYDYCHPEEAAVAEATEKAAAAASAAVFEEHSRST